MKHLLVVFHSQSGKNARMADAVVRGARHPDVDAVDTRVLRCVDAGPGDLLWCDGVIFGTPENFGYLSGAMKDFLDRTFYPCEGRIEGLPYTAFIGTGNDGTGALAALRRIVKGFPLNEVQEPIVAAGALDDETLARCEELGMAMAAGLEAGIF